MPATPFAVVKDLLVDGAAAAKLSRDKRHKIAVALILCSGLTMAGMMVLLKLGADKLSLWQLIVFKSILPMLVLLLLFRVERISIIPKGFFWSLCPSCWSGSGSGGLLDLLDCAFAPGRGHGHQLFQRAHRPLARRRNAVRALDRTESCNNAGGLSWCTFCDGHFQWWNFARWSGRCGRGRLRSATYDHNQAIDNERANPAHDVFPASRNDAALFCPSSPHLASDGQHNHRFGFRNGPFGPGEPMVLYFCLQAV